MSIRKKKIISFVWVFGLSLIVFYLIHLSPKMAEVLTTSDQLTLPYIEQDLWRGGFERLRSWQLSRAPYLFPDHIAYFISYAFTQSTRMSILLFTFFPFFIFVVSWWTLLGRFKNDSPLLNKVLIFSPLLFWVCLVPLYLSEGYFYLVTHYVFLGQNHFGVFGVSLLTLLVFYANLNRSSRWADLSFVFLVSASLLSDQLFMLNFVIPLAFCYGVQKLKGEALPRTYLRFIALSGLSIFMHLLFNPLISKQPSNVGEWGWFGSLKRMIGAFFSLLRLYPIGTILFLLIPMGFALYYWKKRDFLNSDLISDLRSILKKKKKEHHLDSDWIWNHFVLWSFFSVAGTLGGVGVSGVFTDISSIRYLMPVFFLPFCILSGAALRKDYSFTAFQLRGALALIFFIPFGLFLVSAAKIPQILTWHTSLGDCLLKYQKSYPLQDGIAEYWNAKRSEAATSERLRLVQVVQSGHIALWGNRYFDYVEDRRDESRWPTFNFVIVDGRLEAPAVQEFYGTPREKLSCEGGEQIWVYSNSADLYGRLIQSEARLFWEHLKRRKTAKVPAAAIVGPVGHRVGTSRMATHIDPAGVLCGGTYLRAKRGKYRVRFEGEVEGEHSFRLFSKALPGGEIRKSIQAEPSGKFKNEFEFELDTANLPLGLEVIYSGKGKLQLDSVYFEYL